MSRIPIRIAAPSKYHAKRQDGYASKREAKYAADLRVLLNAGLIKYLREQVRYELIPAENGDRAVCYVADFVYEDSEGGVHVVDVKGFKTPVYKLKRRLMKHVHGIEVEEV